MAELLLSLLRIDGGTQPRAEIDMFVAEEYATAMQTGAIFPPLEVMFDGVAYWLWDGFHRYHAATKAGLKSFACKISNGTVDAARWQSLAANQTHGLRRTNADKRRAVEMALKARPELSDSVIAEHVGVSQPFVGKVRTENIATNNGYKSPERIGKDGRTINTANIGKPAAAPAMPELWQEQGIAPPASDVTPEIPTAAEPIVAELDTDSVPHTVPAIPASVSDEPQKTTEDRRHPQQDKTDEVERLHSEFVQVALPLWYQMRKAGGLKRLTSLSAYLRRAIASTLLDIAKEMQEEAQAIYPMEG